MDWLDIVRLVGVILVWICLIFDFALIFSLRQKHKAVDKLFDEAINGMKSAYTCMSIANRMKREYEEKYGNKDPLTSEEN